jgi:hypothetical protein
MAGGFVGRQAYHGQIRRAPADFEAQAFQLGQRIGQFFAGFFRGH